MWDNATVYEINHHTDPQEPYKVKFDARIIDEVKKQVSDFTKFHDFSKKLREIFFSQAFSKKVRSKYIAYTEPAKVRLQVGTRIVGK